MRPQRDPRVITVLGTLFAKFKHSQRGLAAVEFAILLPVMVLFYLGSYQISDAIGADRMTTLAASTVANITTQYSTISASNDMPGILDAAATVLTPYNVANAKITVSLINISANGSATVGWSQSMNGTARIVGSSVTVPPALDTPNTSLVFGEVTYAYTPLYDYLNLGTVNLYQSVYMLPRSQSGTITLTP